MKDFYKRFKKHLILILTIVVFGYSMFNNIPAYFLGNLISHYSENRLKLYNPDGTFWDGKGLLTAFNPKTKKITPLALINWKVSAGIKKFIDIRFKVGQIPAAELYLDKNGLNLDKLNLSLSITQLSQVLDLISNFELSGNLTVSASHLLISSHSLGKITVAIKTLSSGLSPVNPLGSYNFAFDLATNNINVNSNPASTLNFTADGNLQSLVLKCKVDPAKRSKMLEFITVMGVPNQDGSYNMKIY